MTPKTLKIITLNCQRGHLLSQLQLFLEKLITDKEVDFLLVQEVDPKVAHILKESIKKHYSYQLYLPENTETKKSAEVGILYKTNFKLIEKQYVSYKQFVRKQSNETGGALAVFQLQNEILPLQNRIVICSSHLHASYHFRARRKELVFIKNLILQYNDENTVCVLGGDFNYLLPGELRKGNSILQPELVHITNYKEHSCNSSLLEPTEFQNKLFRFLAKIGLKFLLKIDHVYVDKDSLAHVNYDSRVLDVEVSDHRPVETILKPSI